MINLVQEKRRDPIVGKEYQVVVRSWDRFDDYEDFNELNRTWQNLNNLFLQTSPDIEAVRPRFEYVDCWEHLTTIEQQPVNQLFLGLILTCPLCLNQYQEQRKKLFRWILKAGIPIALWSRCSNLANLQEEMHNLITADTVCQLDLLEDKLLEQIKQTRKNANDAQHLGHHLAIWCDEPKRLIQLKQFLKAKKLGG